MGEMRVVKLREGLWQWGCPMTERGAGRQAWSTYYEAADATVVIDPVLPCLASDLERFWRALDTDVAKRPVPARVLLTSERHARSADEIAERYGVSVAGPTPSPARTPLQVHPAHGVTLVDPPIPGPAREVAFRIGRDVLVTGDVITCAGTTPAVASRGPDRSQSGIPATGSDDLAAVVAGLLSPLPAMILTGHGHETDQARIAAFARSLARR